MLLFALGFAHAQSSSVEPFHGQWSLDLERSGSIERLLVAQGASWLERKLASSVTPTLIISPVVGGLRFATESSMGTRVDEVVPDGVVRPATTRRGVVRCSTRWDDEELLTSCTEKTGVWIVRRSVHDDRLHQRVRFEPVTGPPVEALRVFEKRR